MKILHVTPHLDGDVGKAHAAVSAALPDVVAQTFILLEPLGDRRFIDRIEAAGAQVAIAEGLDHVVALAREADIVQFEFWNHPRMLACLTRAEFPAMRSVFWSHMSGLFGQAIQPGLIEQAHRFVFTTGVSLSIPSVAALSAEARKKIAVINSGFGYPNMPARTARGRKPGVAYLGTVDFAKMHPGLFDAIDALIGDDVRITIWGDGDRAGEVIARARAMRHPERVNFMGPTCDPVAALANADIFFYPLQRDHVGTAENALVEAMSLGLVPLVLNNPAEMEIVRDAATGFVASSIEEIGSLLQSLLLLPDVREMFSRNAIRHVAKTRTPAMSVQDFMIQWLGLLAEPRRHCDFKSAMVEDPPDRPGVRPAFVSPPRATTSG